MKEYDLIVIGTGSVMSLVDPMIQRNPRIKIAVIDKDQPGGICLTRGCIPSKILLYPAELVRLIGKGKEFGLNVKLESVDFGKIMERMRNLIDPEIAAIGKGLSSSANIDYYRDEAEFASPYVLKVSGETITSKMIFLGSGSTPIIPKIKGIGNIPYLTSDTILNLKTLPPSIAILGGGYIAAEYGHFLSSMGADVTVIGRNPVFLPQEEPEISELAKLELGKHMKILTNKTVLSTEKSGKLIKINIEDRDSGSKETIETDALLVATGRGPLNSILKPERGGIETAEGGWIKVNEYLETNKPGIWAIGDAKGKYLFKHVANYDSEILYYNVVLGRKIRADYSSVPHAVFTYPEIASVGMRERECLEKFEKAEIAMGFYEYKNTAKGEAINAGDYFVKLLVRAKDSRILGGHIIGPYASQLIHDVIVAMNASDHSLKTLQRAMYIHPAMDEVVQRAAGNLMSVDEYHHHMKHIQAGWAR